MGEAVSTWKEKGIARKSERYRGDATIAEDNRWDQLMERMENYDKILANDHLYFVNGWNFVNVKKEPVRDYCLALVDIYIILINRQGLPHLVYFRQDGA